MTYLFETNDWTFERLNTVMDAIKEIADKELGLTYYPIQIEIVGSQEMLDLYSEHGLPQMYHHWSFGKSEITNTKAYQQGQMGLAFEIIQNTCPSIAYLMDTNSMMMQTLVLAHAAIGHNSFFASNYLFKTWTDASSILDYVAYAKKYIHECEEKYGYESVEELLDCCHSLQLNGVDRYNRPPPLSMENEKKKQKERQELLQQQINVLWATLPNSPVRKPSQLEVVKKFPEEPEENLLYFLEKYSPVLEMWEREIVRIVRKIAQYFYPNMQTRTINEGWACFIHYYIVNRLWEKKLITDGSYLEFIRSHTAVCFQPDYNEMRLTRHGLMHIYNGINPYALGFEMFMDIKRICQEPTEEDRKWFPEIAGSDWVKTCRDAMMNYRDESFISQFLSPHLIRKWRFFHCEDQGEDHDHLTVKNIHNDDGYKAVRQALSKAHDLNTHIPNLAVWDVDMKGTRKLELRHLAHDNVTLARASAGALKNFTILWGFDVDIKSVDIATGKPLELIQISPVSKSVPAPAPGRP